METNLQNKIIFTQDSYKPIKKLRISRLEKKCNSINTTRKNHIERNISCTLFLSLSNSLKKYEQHLTVHSQEYMSGALLFCRANELLKSNIIFQIHVYIQTANNKKLLVIRPLRIPCVQIMNGASILLESHSANNTILASILQHNFSTNTTYALQNEGK
jgi:hypothetical protein